LKSNFKRKRAAYAAGGSLFLLAGYNMQDYRKQQAQYAIDTADNRQSNQVSASLRIISR
jgi:hypothetical protein